MLCETKVVTIGGGTGLSTMLRGLKKYTHNITAVVTVADDGGSSGVLREDLGMLAPGDIRKCISALAETNPVVEELINYRFTDGWLKGHAFGNLYLAALCGISANFEEAVRKMNRIFGVEGEILPVTNENIKLRAYLENGKIINGESRIGSVCDSRIERVEMLPSYAEPAKNVLDAISEADMIILGPGSLYTSIIPNLLVDGVGEAIYHSKARKIYVANIMTQPSETTGYDLYDHIEAIEKHAGYKIIEYVVANTAKIPPELSERYAKEGSEPVRLNIERYIDRNVRLVLENLYINDNGMIRHNHARLAKTLMRLRRECNEIR